MRDRETIAYITVVRTVVNSARQKIAKTRQRDGTAQKVEQDETV